MVLATQGQSFELSAEEEKGAKKPKVGALCAPFFPSTNYAFSSVSQLLYHRGTYSLITSLIYLVSSPLHPYLLWFSVVPVRKEVERWLLEVWPRPWGHLVRWCLLPLCMEEGGEMGLGSRCWGISHRKKQTKTKGCVPWN